MIFKYKDLGVVIDRDKCEINEICTEDENSYLQGTKLINYTCECGKEHSKIFRLMYYNGAFCSSCVELKRLKKIKETKATKIKKLESEEDIKTRELKNKLNSLLENYDVKKVKVKKIKKVKVEKIKKENMCEKCNFNRYKNELCINCYISEFPDIVYPKTVISKARERIIFNELISLISKKLDMKLDFVLDKSIIYGSRPDCWCDLITHFVIIENDENSHKSYALVDEQNRILDLYKHLKKPLVVIRFNCNHYYRDGIRYDDMFQKDLTRNEEIFNERIAKLANTFIKYYSKYDRDKIIVEYLYYDKHKIGFRKNDNVDVVVSY